ncbi:hypothetical protein HDV05_004166 [Chytridiales sp. JEL 0842]|nr:hypothetical protein HDV05_004166 [Chytridiales sp. JEL 0842]
MMLPTSAVAAPYQTSSDASTSIALSPVSATSTLTSRYPPISSPRSTSTSSSTSSPNRRSRSRSDNAEPGMNPEASRQTYLLLLTVLPEAIIEAMLNPLIPFLARSLKPLPEYASRGTFEPSADLAPTASVILHELPPKPLSTITHLLPRTSSPSTSTTPVDIGSRSGLFFAAFYFPLLLMNILWGTLSDGPLGRKPILLLGLVICGSAAFTLGSTQYFSVAVFCRFLAGVFGANSTVAKGALGEIHQREDGRAWAYARYGQLFGPILGGLLVSKQTVPSDSLPSASLESSFLETYPYFIPCTFGAVLAALSTLVTVRYFKEPKELRMNRRGGAGYVQVVNQGSNIGDDDEEEQDDDSGHSKRLRWWEPVLNSFKVPIHPKVVFPIGLYHSATWPG